MTGRCWGHASSHCPQAMQSDARTPAAVAEAYSSRA